MKRLLSMTALGMALLLSLSLSLQAQRGGGRSFGGGFGGGHAGSGFRSSSPAGPRGFAPGRARGFAPGGGARFFAPAPGGRSFAPRTFAPRTFGSRTFGTRTFGTRSFAPRTFGARTFASNGFGAFGPSHRFFRPFPGHRAGFRRFHDRFFFRSRFFFPGCFGCVSPFFFGGGLFFGDPFFPGYYSGFGPDYYAYGPPPPPPVVINTDNGGSAQLAVEVERLSDEVDDLRQEQSRADSRPAPAPNTSISVNAPGMPVSFIFRDGRRISARNYAIAGQTLWILDEHAAKKFVLDDLDKDATQQANAANGIDIHFPIAPEKQ